MIAAQGRGLFGAGRFFGAGLALIRLDLCELVGVLGRSASGSQGRRRTGRRDHRGTGPWDHGTTACSGGKGEWFFHGVWFSYGRI